MFQLLLQRMVLRQQRLQTWWRSLWSQILKWWRQKEEEEKYGGGYNWYWGVGIPSYTSSWNLTGSKNWDEDEDEDSGGKDRRRLRQAAAKVSIGRGRGGSIGLFRIILYVNEEPFLRFCFIYNWCSRDKRRRMFPLLKKNLIQILLREMITAAVRLFCVTKLNPVWILSVYKNCWRIKIYSLNTLHGYEF